ncbi:hypothetical protein [Mangrovihabitans endophyticus]|uniref:hypothetical protein n=1 Tax=Mangrovihabitans endophyticus TaxID=1751298 RepID=UPI00166D0006|nr:hypothetical protein [Mangrovihabitans endophyticus]
MEDTDADTRAAASSARDTDNEALVGRSDSQSRDILAACSEPPDFAVLRNAVTELGVSYGASAPGPVLAEAFALRSRLYRALGAGTAAPQRLSQYCVTVGYASGVLSYAALDLGHPRSAETHCAVIWRMAQLCDNDDLRAWARGTQSLIARFRQQFVSAQMYAEDGLRYARTAAGRTRLLCAAAQSAAHRGDIVRVRTFISQARRSSESITDNDNDGIFGFSPAKQRYYAASSLMWLSDKKALNSAAVNANDAICLWRQRPAARRPFDDETLAHIYLATTMIKLGDLDAANHAVTPVLNLTGERRTSWMRRRITNLEAALNDRYPRDPAASPLKHRLRKFRAA